MDSKKIQDHCKYQVQKQELDNFYHNLDEYYSELKSRLIELINDNYFEKDVEFFITKMFKLDDKNDNDFNVISYIEKLKYFSDELYLNHKSYCSNELIKKLLLRIDKLNEKVDSLSKENSYYQQKIEQISSDLKQSQYKKISKIEFESLNINYNNNPIYLNSKKNITSSSPLIDKNHIVKEKEKLNTLISDSYRKNNKSLSLSNNKEFSKSKENVLKSCTNKINLDLNKIDFKINREDNSTPLSNKFNKISSIIPENIVNLDAPSISPSLYTNINSKSKIYTSINKEMDSFSRNIKYNQNQIEVSLIDLEKNK